MKMTIDMPYVADCMIADCAYNLKNKCHARAITIGDGTNPACDTSFLGGSKHTHNTKQIAGVGACKITGCNFNDDLECTAENITVDMRNGDISCMTFTAR